MNAYEEQRSRNRLELDENKPVLIECLGEPETINGPEGAFQVVAVKLVKTGETFSLSLGRKVLHDRIMAKAPLIGKQLVVMNLGKPRGKRYFDYIVMTLEEFKKFKEDRKKAK